MNKLKQQFTLFERQNLNLYKDLNFVASFCNGVISEKIKKAILESKNDQLLCYNKLIESNLISYYDKVAEYMGWDSEFEILTEGEYPQIDGYSDLGDIPNLYDPANEDPEQSETFEGEYPVYWVYTDINNKTFLIQYDSDLEAKIEQEKLPNNKVGFADLKDAQYEYKRRGGQL